MAPAAQDVREALHLTISDLDLVRAELLARIDELVALLIDSGVVVPPSGKKEKAARDDEERDKRR